jgi:hypothetical protein
MKLSAFLESRKINPAAFAAGTGLARQAVHRYIAGERIPDKSAMAKIVAATEGEVTPNDFYGAEPSPQTGGVVS